MTTGSNLSLLLLLRRGAGATWDRQRRDAQSRPAYNVIIVGAGSRYVWDSLEAVRRTFLDPA